MSDFNAYELTQFILVRRDLPLEKIVVYAAHAAGKAMFAYCAKLAHEGLWAQAKWETLDPQWGFPYRIVRGARNEAKLNKARKTLIEAGVTLAEIVEPDDGPFKGQLVALATFPGVKDRLSALLNDYQDLRMKDVPAFAEAVRAGKVG